MLVLFYKNVTMPLLLPVQMFKLQQTALHCQQPCGGLFNLLYPVITMGFFLAWQDSLANRT